MSQCCAAALGQFEGLKGTVHGQPCAFARVVGAGWVALWIWMAGHACAASSRRLVRTSCACGVCPAGGAGAAGLLGGCGDRVVVVLWGCVWRCGFGCVDRCMRAIQSKVCVFTTRSLNQSARCECLCEGWRLSVTWAWRSQPAQLLRWFVMHSCTYAFGTRN
jgi:hypothetical protein